MLDVVTSANVACGFHAGDAATLARTCRAAAERGVRIGAQVSYRDLAGFGRRFIDATPEDLRADVIYQIGALQALAHAAGSTVSYVKPHGALYNTIVNNHGQARAVAEAVHAVDPGLPVLGLSGSVFFAEAQELGLRTVPEAFADRAYRSDGQLVSRRQRNAVLHDIAEIADRVASMVTAGRVAAVDGSTIPITVESVCVHGDSPGQCRSPTRCGTGWWPTASNSRRSSDAPQARPAGPGGLRGLLRCAGGRARRTADGDVGRRHHAADRRRHVRVDDRRLLLAARPARGRVEATVAVGAADRRLPDPPRGGPAGGGAAGAHAFRPRDGLGSGRRTHRRTSGRRDVGGAGRPRRGAARRSPRRRHTGRADNARRIRRHADRGGTLPARPLSGRYPRTRRAAGQGLCVQVRRGVVDAGAPPAVGSAAADRRQRRLRPRRARRAAGRGRVSGRGATRAATRAVPHRLLDRNRAHRRRPPRRAHSLGRLLPPAAQAAAGAAVRR